MLTGTTTAIGFGSNVIGAIPFIQDFALATTIGMMINLVITIVLVPLLLAWWFPRPTARIASIGQRSRRLGQFLERATRPLVATPRRRKPVLAAVFALTGLSLATIIGLTPSIDPIAMINRQAQVVQDIDFFQARMTGLNLFYAVVETNSGSLLEPDRLERLAALEAEAKGLFGSAVSIADYVTLTHRAFTGAAAASPPPALEATEQYLLFHDLGELRHFLADERQQALILVRHPYFDSREINRRLELLTSRAATLFAGSGLSLEVTGQNILVNRSAESLVESQFISFVALLVVTALFLAAAFRSLAVGLISLIPNVLPGAFVFAVIAILDLPFNPGTGVAAMVCFGIAVDDTIHMINAHMLRTTGETDMPLLEEQALAVTLTVTCVSLAFLAFAFSEFSVVWHFGLLGAIGLWCAWVTDVVVTPLLLDVAGRVAQRRAAVRAA
ncbi:hypothetical protein D3874_08055 [Oleomonas cavernae]|uniref:SSD domain-containing protein n=1 Tax=Oleomonas cavernae TaxID=2320859 RepID=A0A418WAL1_9PROT|nr:MMPL family transporter [Oleomonas cavernae]RJF86974.1 hypothetical protein D3874_08055 [Oleomonas cavernae]